MEALRFWKTVAVDDANLIERLVGLLDAEDVDYCVIGGQGVNAYVEPLVSLDLDLVVATHDLSRIRTQLEENFRLEIFAHSLNLSLPGSALRVQIRTDPRYAPFVAGAERRNVLGLSMPVAKLEDVLRGKVWAAQDPARRPSKRQKDLADIARILEARPDLRGSVPEELLTKLL
jgi:hypothetical protein